jgi:hypothetical protein
MSSGVQNSAATRNVDPQHPSGPPLEEGSGIAFQGIPKMPDDNAVRTVPTLMVSRLRYRGELQ